MADSAEVPAPGAQAPPTAPILRLETGMHMARMRLCVDPRGQLALTVSDDKTARLWSLEDGKQLHILRPPIGDGSEGKLWACALSPDGAIAAVGGWTGKEWDGTNTIYLFDTRLGKMLARLPGLPEVVDALAFSPDGSRLAAGLGGQNGIHVWRTADWGLSWQDADYGADIYGLVFGRQGDLFASSLDGKLRHYDSGGTLVHPAVAAPGGDRPMVLALSPDGARLAVGYHDKGRVDILAAHDLSLLATPDATGLNGGTGTVAWSADGTSLFAAGSARHADGRTIVRAWADGGHGTWADLPAAVDSVMSLALVGQQDLAFASSRPIWGRLHPDGVVNPRLVPATPDYRWAGDAFRVSPDGKTVQFGFQMRGQQPAMFSLQDRRVGPPPADDGGLVAPLLAAPGIVVANWEESEAPTLNGAAIPFRKYERCWSVAIAGSRLLVGSEWYLRLFDPAAGHVWEIDAPGATFAVNATPDGRLAVAAFADGTIRWYRLADGVELLALFPHNDGKRWVAWTPGGYYDASVGGDDLIGWHVNRGADQAADFFPAKQFSQHNRPDIVGLVLDTLDEGLAEQAANATTGRKSPGPVAALLPPVVKILAPLNLSSVATSPVDVTYFVRSPTPVTGITVFVDGRPVATPAPVEITSGATETVATVSVPMPPHHAKISLVAANAQSSSEEAVVQVGWHGETDWYKPDLYVLSVGVAKYMDTSLTLKYPGKDASDFAALARAQEGGLYNHVTVRELPDNSATREEIRKGLSWLKKTPTRDVAMLFLSGHGQTDASGNYHYLPYDTDETDLDLTAIQDFEIENFLGNVPGKVVAFLDTCFAGGVGGKKGPTQPDVDRLANRLASAEKGVVVFTSSTGRQFSQERDEWQNGAFTKALVEAFKGGADYQKDKRITIAALEVYLSHRVQELTDGAQSPASAKPRTIENLVIATVVP